MDTDERRLNEVSERIIGCAYRVANTLGNGFLEKVYENALAYELTKSGLKVEQQKRINVFYDSTLVGEYVADLIVEDSVVVETKTARTIDEVHMAQCLNYLKATGLKLALLLNFGTPRITIRRVVNDL